VPEHYCVHGSTLFIRLTLPVGQYDSGLLSARFQQALRDGRCRTTSAPDIININSTSISRICRLAARQLVITQSTAACLISLPRPTQMNYKANMRTAAATSLLFLAGQSLSATSPADYVIIGGGTAGLVLANRLSEDTSVTVTVIESGADERRNPNVTGTDKFSQAFNTHIDWNYTTVPQPRANNRSLTLHQGKAWGGTSTINGMTYIRGDALDFDLWQKLGNPAWNWTALLPYFLKAENYTIPTATQLAAGATYHRKYHGFNGPLKVGYTSALRNGSFAPLIMGAWEDILGLRKNEDLNGGDVHGYGMGPQTLGDGVRWDAARGYYHPVEDRPNLKIVRGTARRVLWREEGRGRGAEGLEIAKGVEFLNGEGVLERMEARREVIVSAGGVRSPLVLEASGIGNPRFVNHLRCRCLVARM